VTKGGKGALGGKGYAVRFSLEFHLARVVSGDGRILKNPAALQVLKDLTITFFLFAGSWFSLKWPEFAWKAVKVWPEVIAAASPPRPSVYRIPVSATKVEFVSYTDDLGGRTKR